MRQVIKGMVLLLMVLVCSQGMANETIQKKIIWKIFPIDEKAVIISNDYQIWLLQGLQPNRLTWSEWVWKEEVPQPDPSYFFDVKKWEEGKAISIVYSPWQDSKWKDTYRNDTSSLRHCDYVIENDAYKTTVFAKPLQKDEWVAVYDIFFNKSKDLAKRGFYNHAAIELEKLTVFNEFRDKVFTECKNKIKGRPFDEHYTAFNEKYGLCQLD